MMIADYAHYCTETLYNKYPCRCNYIVCSNVYVNVDDEVLKKRLGRAINTSKITIGLIGQVNNNNKGIDTAIKALGKLDSHCELQVVGGGETKKWLELAEKEGVKNRILFLGYISEKNAINSWLDNCDIYIQPSLSEGLPRSTIEAMARGCPVVASNVGAIPTIIEEEFLINPNNYIDLAKKIQLLISNSKKYRETEIRNFETSRKFDQRIIRKKIDEYYNHIK